MIKFYDDYDDYACSKLYCNAGVAILGSAVIGAASSAFGASKASSAQQDAAAQAGQIAQQQYKKTRKDLEPYRELGLKYATELDERMPELTSDINIDEQLKNPESIAARAYDFTKTQGLKAAQNSAAARGLGVSGAALKGATSFVTGLADNTYTNLFNMERSNRQDQYSRLKGLVDTGQTASGATATAGTAAANTSASAAMASGNAEAAGYNAIAGAVSQGAKDIGGYYAYKGMYGGNQNKGEGAYSV